MTQILSVILLRIHVRGEKQRESWEKDEDFTMIHEVSKYICYQKDSHYNEVSDPNEEHKSGKWRNLPWW